MGSTLDMDCPPMFQAFSLRDVRKCETFWWRLGTGWEVRSEDMGSKKIGGVLPGTQVVCFLQGEKNSKHVLFLPFRPATMAAVFFSEPFNLNLESFGAISFNTPNLAKFPSISSST